MDGHMKKRMGISLKRRKLRGDKRGKMKEKWGKPSHLSPSNGDKWLNDQPVILAI